LVEWVKNSKDRLTYVSGGPGSHMNLSMVRFLQRTGLDIAAVHLRGGSEPMNNVVAGHVPMGFMNASDVVQQASAGNIRALAVTSKERIPQMPDLPTMIESGFDYSSNSWNGVVAPAATPKAIIDLLSAEVQKAVKDPKFSERLISLGVAPIGNNPTEFAKEIASDVKLYGDIVRGAGLGEN
jgi:tripartite-type tricarboxylate transporter receptor subunit TctC